MTEPRVAVVVRTKNRPDLLERALRSITSQTLAEWECIIVNDGGDRDPVEALVSVLPPHQREQVRIIHHETPRGRWISANAGVLAATAPLLVLHDDDDTWHPEFLDRAASYLEREDNTHRGGVVSRIEIVWEEQTERGFVETGRDIFQPQLTAPTLSDALLFNRFVPIGFVYRRSIHQELGLYDESLPVVGDWNFALKVLTRGPLEYLGPVPYAYWHQRPGQGGNSGNSVIEAREDHRRVDAQIRDAALREYVQQHGIGLPLYLTKFIDQRLVDVESRLVAEVERYSLPERAGRTIKKLFGRG
ncbi:glycosyltransferase family 2 protein [Microbacterium amylolyticum]|uniref:Glycosyltransferase involved in cell wall biosynthesis n=1 Tax=Microbacterium amylolyticum TaxID=936337 RepID=A0ABS4ZJV0_9MICO|nr:glycosyltransferase family 2 protein [Microbacterium amylolyticum]MBP2437563.1 glycosyltransferase involved in cell wall biosynthesis [Microbacterium amylolyticum]